MRPAGRTILSPVAPAYQILYGISMQQSAAWILHAIMQGVPAAAKGRQRHILQCVWDTRQGAENIAYAEHIPPAEAPEYSQLP